MINARPVVGIEGTHGSGKSAVAAALVAQLRERGFGPQLLDDAGRLSPLVRDAVASGGRVDLMGELSLFGRRVQAELEGAREGGIVVCDRTVLAGLGYLLADAPDEERRSPLGSAFEAMCTEYARATYDLVVLLDRSFDWSGDSWADDRRYAGAARQERFKALALDLCLKAGVPTLVVTSTAGACEVATTIVDELIDRRLLLAGASSGRRRGT